ncbi:hypothetical protein R3P38DRAFT_2764141 [Favolaschia claudopus]|uniref:Uncharacterized protein n=1 Tax=Favolaschia claudopus TaxID=2862362 RepID=A0AAW0D9Q9_9AGAR
MDVEGTSCQKSIPEYLTASSEVRLAYVLNNIVQGQHKSKFLKTTYFLGSNFICFHIKHIASWSLPFKFTTPEPKSNAEREKYLRAAPSSATQPPTMMWSQVFSFCILVLFPLRRRSGFIQGANKILSFRRMCMTGRKRNPKPTIASVTRKAVEVHNTNDMPGMLVGRRWSADFCVGSARQGGGIASAMPISADQKDTAVLWNRIRTVSVRYTAGLNRNRTSIFKMRYGTVS